MTQPGKGFRMHVAVTPSNWAGLGVALATCLGSWLWVMVLFDWDNPDRPKGDRHRDIVRGLFDAPRSGDPGPARHRN